ncbi:MULTISPECIES: hypothetical protein [unclassified Streptomyces]|uniref:hypothetical protein n=1 Tax=unclassified Streptomyces TaxID=2593676 RepID=UPI003640B128
MSESSFDYRQARGEQGAACADPHDLARYMRRISMDAHSLRQGLAQAVTHVFVGAAPSDGESKELPFPANRVERALFEDSMGSVAQVLVADPVLAVALRHAMRLLEDAADAAHVVRALLERPDGGAAMDRLSAEADLTPEGEAG